MKLQILAASAAALLTTFTHTNAQIILSGSSTYVQNFDSIGTENRTWVDSGFLHGWYAGINANNTPDGRVTATDGTNGGRVGLLNLGEVLDPDRALGSKVTGSTQPDGFSYANIAYGVLFFNNSGLTLDVTNIAYTGELWRTNTTPAPGVAEQWVTFYKISPTTITDVEPGGDSATANAGSFTAIPALDWASPTNQPSNTALFGNDPANRATRSIDPNLTIASGQFFMFRWVDTNLGGTDGQQGIDDFSITFSVLPRPLIYNLNHAVGGAPNGVLGVSASQYWLRNGTPTGFTTGDPLEFSQNGIATITVPAPVTAGVLTISNTSGLYTLITEADTTVNAINGPSSLIKSGTARLIVNGPSTGSGALTIADGTLTLDSTTGGTVTSTIRGVGGVTVIGTGIAVIGGAPNESTNNDYTGVTTVSSGATLVAGKAAGFNAVGGDLVIQSGASFRYTGNNASNQIADTATVTINGGTFGDPISTGPTNPGATDTVANVIVIGGEFNSGRNATVGPFTITGTLTVNTGVARAQRGGSISAHTVQITAGSVNLDGGSTATFNESRLDVGAGGLLLNAGTINFNAGPSTPEAASVGSILNLLGNVTSIGANRFVRMNTLVPTAVVDLNGGERVFNVEGSLNIG
ncbi:MAG: hypothetical protein ABIS03_14070, partial [Gemmatimonadaceae bacterium]